MPPQPRAWRTVIARRRAIDILRREQDRPDKERDGLRMIELAGSDLPTDDVVDDGLSPAQIAGVLLTTEAATTKRLTRARQKIAMHPGDEEGRMLRSPGLETAGKFYAFATAADVVVKLPSSRVDELIDSGRGLPCSPRPGRPMKDWVRIPVLDQESCLAYLLDARAFVSAAARNRRD